MASYILGHDFEQELARLEALQRLSDDASIRALASTGVTAGWRCADIGAGAGSIACWLARCVGSAGRVVAADTEPKFLRRLEQPPLEVRQFNILEGPLEPATFDLVHTRFLLMHLPDRATALQHLIHSVRPGGWLVLEDGDFQQYSQSFPEFEPLQRAGEAIVASMQRAGIDTRYGLRLPHDMAGAGLEIKRIDAQQIIGLCGADAIAAWSLLLDYLGPRLTAGGLLNEEDLTAAMQLLTSPPISTAVYGPVLVSVVAHKPW